MTQNNWIELGLALLCTLLAFLLAEAETAITQTSKGRAELFVDDERPGAQRLHKIAEDPAPYVNTTMLLRTAFEIVAIVLVCQVTFHHVQGIWPRMGIAAGGMTLVSFILWGVAPLTIGRQRSDSIALRAAGPVQMLTSLLGPLPQLMILVGNALTPGRGFADGPFSTEAELRDMVDQAEASDLIEASESKMIHSVFELGDTIVREVMVPRPDMVFIHADKTLRQGLSLALRSGFSRIPVVGEGLDDIVGMVYLKDMVKRSYDNPDAERTETVAQLMRTAHFCPDSKPASDLMREMQRDRNHVVVVVDEFGGTAGLVSIEDILEEIVGEIVDEYDAEPTHTEELEPGVFRISARLPIDELGDLFGLELDDEDVDTVGGLMAKQLNVVPIPGSVVDWEGLRIEAEKAAGRRHQIDTCLVQRTPEETITSSDERIEEDHG
ncbi:CBS domain containing-hemolysin-like protein [Luteococcus japonicus]|uniref:CBS domain containing-hemolysin-like protein n=1 Tax=Luteococcus japonicus TaxID=33984 RepID=A0A3N1ZQJ0_9ACTN|nr:hemolysin family protein [Luteococcus japonicus]ROR53170.1 CBS domain containing-hemolysin-like protein [Luteococcus japonicus]